MSADRDLLVLAAKAAGIEIVTWSNSPDQAGGFMPVTNPWKSNFWNPLTDDGDALRLAVDAGVAFEQNDSFKRACALVWLPSRVLRTEFFQPWNNDKRAATRRAIVCAAAAIGEVKQ